MSNKDTTNCSGLVIQSIGPAKLVDSAIIGVRLARKPSGELVIQTAHYWKQGPISGIDWTTRDTVQLDEHGNAV